MKINLRDLTKGMDTAMSSDSFQFEFEVIEAAAKENKAVIAKMLIDPTLSEEERQIIQGLQVDHERVIFYCSTLKLTSQGMTFEEIHLKHFPKIALGNVYDNYFAGMQLFLNRYRILTRGE